MASGTFTMFLFNPILTATDNSCKAVREAIDTYYWSTGISSRKTLGCSTDPVAVSTKIYSSTSATAAVSQSVVSINAKPFKKMDWFDSAHLIQALLVVAVVMMFVRGFDSGNKL